ncbi:hypothetical protein EJB05_17704, partial [Eragrostis curvula]
MLSGTTLRIGFLKKHLQIKARTSGPDNVTLPDSVFVRAFMRGVMPPAALVLMRAWFGWCAGLAQTGDQEFDLLVKEKKYLCTIMYTGGTTGVIISNVSIICLIAGVDRLLNCVNEELAESDIYMSYLPLAHIFDFVMEELFMFHGVSIGLLFYFWTLITDVKVLVEEIGVLKPTNVCAVPRVLDRIFSRLEAKIPSGGFVNSTLFNLAYKYKQFRMMRGAKQNESNAICDKLVFHKVEEGLGGRVIMSSAAPLAIYVEEYLHVVTCVIQGYASQSEARSALLHHPNNHEQPAVSTEHNRAILLEPLSQIDPQTASTEHNQAIPHELLSLIDLLCRSPAAHLRLRSHAQLLRTAPRPLLLALQLGRSLPKATTDSSSALACLASLRQSLLRAPPVTAAWSPSRDTQLCLMGTCAGPFVSLPNQMSMLGTVGPPVPIDVRLESAPEMEYDVPSRARGEICIRRETLFSGYYKRADLTKEVSVDGLFHTGEIGEWQPDGSMKIIDRKKNIFKLPQGGYVAAIDSFEAEEIVDKNLTRSRDLLDVKYKEPIEKSCKVLHLRKWRNFFIVFLAIFLVSMVQCANAQYENDVCPAKKMPPSFLPRETCPIVHVSGPHWIHSKRVKFLTPEGRPPQSLHSSMKDLGFLLALASCVTT